MYGSTSLHLFSNFTKALDNNLTPVVWHNPTPVVAHALVIDSIQTSDQNESFYICKNTIKERLEQFDDSPIHIMLLTRL